MKRALFAVLGVVAIGAITVCWYFAFPDDNHHSLQYNLWKHGLYPFHEKFEGAFMADVHREDIVLGKTKAQLAQKFAPLGEGVRNEKYWGDFYARYPGDEFVWLWNTDWVVVMHDGKAIYTLYLKG